MAPPNNPFFTVDDFIVKYTQQAAGFKMNQFIIGAY
jgi:hypothetical protein